MATPGSQRAYHENLATGNSRVQYGDVNNYYGKAEESSRGIRAALFVTDPRMDRLDIASVRGEIVPGTCDWIKNHALFKSWYNQEFSALWLSGGPGKGKTAFAMFITDLLEQQFADTDCKVASFFCDYRDTGKCTSTAVLRTLLWQVAKHETDAWAALAPYFDGKKREAASLGSFNTLWSMLGIALANMSTKTVYFILDGLDECGEQSIRDLLAKLTATCSPTSGTPYHKLCTLITSRETIRPRLIPQIKLDQEFSDEQSVGILAFVESRVQELSSLPGFNDGFREQLRNLLLDKAETTYLWIGFAMHEMLKQDTCTDVLKAVKALPKGLVNCYDRMLSRIPQQQRESANSLLQWVAMGTRPMTIAELAEAIGILPEQGLTQRLALKDLIITCGPLICVSRRERQAFDIVESEKPFIEIVSLVHKSVLDYLVGEHTRGHQDFNWASVERDLVHATMTRKCVDCIEENLERNRKIGNGNDLETARAAGTTALFTYAATSWHVHAAAASSADNQLWTKTSFLAESSKKRQRLLQSPWSDERAREWTSAPRLHIAVLFGIRPWVEAIMPEVKSRVSKSCWSDHCWIKTTALHLAVLQEDPAMVDLLLEWRANPNVKDNLSYTAFSLACSSGNFNEKILRMLLRAGAYVNAEGPRLGTPLDHAEARSLEDSARAPLCELLLDHGARLGSQLTGNIRHFIRDKLHYTGVLPDSLDMSVMTLSAAGVTYTAASVIVLYQVLSTFLVVWSASTIISLLFITFPLWIFLLGILDGHRRVRALRSLVLDAIAYGP